MKALCIQVDFATGKRAGGINPKDKNLPCNSAWQNTDLGCEIRLVKNGDITPYLGKEGVEILSDEAAIDARVAEIHEPDYAPMNDALMIESIRQKNIDLSQFAGMDAKCLYKCLHEDHGVAGMKKSAAPPCAADLGKCWDCCD